MAPVHAQDSGAAPKLAAVLQIVKVANIPSVSKLVAQKGWLYIALAWRCGCGACVAGGGGCAAVLPDGPSGVFWQKVGDLATHGTAGSSKK